jgi:hypothetical protein
MSRHRRPDDVHRCNDGPDEPLAGMLHHIRMIDLAALT